MLALALGLLLGVAPAPRPTPPPVLEGVVLGPDGKAVENAVILAGRGLPGETPLSARTAADGRFRLDWPDVRPRQLRVEAAGLAPFELAQVRPGPLTVRLQRGAVLEGSVRDPRGQPVPRARVELREERPALALERGAPWREAQSDARGQFRFEGVPPAPLQVAATARGFGRAALRVAPGRRADLVLAPGAWVAGSVKDEAGRPVAGAVLRLESDLMPSAPLRAVSDASGRFELAGLDAGAYRLLAGAPGLAPAAVHVVAGRASGARADVVLPRGLRVTGRLFDEAGQPLSARIELLELSGLASRLLADLLRTEAGADGRFALDRLPEGDHALRASARGRAAARLPIEVAGRTEIDLGDLVIPDGLVLAGRVHDAKGRGVAGARLDAFVSAQAAGEPRRVEGETDASGTFRIAGLGPGRGRLWVRAAGFAEAIVPIQAGREDADVLLQEGGSLAGQVVDESDRPVPSFRIRGEIVEQDEADRGGDFDEEPAPADGRFLVGDLKPGRYGVSIRAPERAPVTLSDVQVKAGAVADLGKVRLTSGLDLSGVVVDSAGAAVPGAAVEATPGGGMNLGVENAGAARTDVNGSFVIRGLAPGTYVVTASHPDFAGGESPALELEVGKPRPEVRLALTRGGRVEGVVRRRGAPFAGARVDVTSPGTYARSRVSARADDEGRFVVERVGPGRCRVDLMVPDAGDDSGGRVRAVAGQEVEVREAETAQADLELRDVLVRGRVLRGEEPVPGALVLLRGGSTSLASGPQTVAAVGWLRARSRPDGGYELLVPRPGRLGLHVMHDSEPIRQQATSVEVPDVEVFALDVEVGPRGVALSGLVVAEEGELPLAGAGVQATPRAPVAERAQLVLGQAGPDGRFVLHVEPGRYLLSAQTRTHATPRLVEVSVGEAGLTDVKLALVPGRTLRGRVVDVRGAGVSGLEIAHGGAYATTLVDGSFELAGLPDAPVSLCTGTRDGRYAVGQFQPGEDALLTLRPGGQVVLQISQPDGGPAAGAWAPVVQVGGLGVSCPEWSGRSDGSGRLARVVPAGAIELHVTLDQLAAQVPLEVPEGGTVTGEVHLTPRETR